MPRGSGGTVPPDGRGVYHYFSCHGGIGVLRGLRVGPCVVTRVYLPPGASRGRGVAAPPRTRAQLVPARTRGSARPGGETPMSRVRDTRITGYEPLLSPAALLDEMPLGEAESQIVERTRAEVRGVLGGADD